MTIQAYSDGMCRVFENHEMLFEFNVTPPLKERVDKLLNKIGVRRSCKWEDYEDCSEAKIRLKERKSK